MVKYLTLLMFLFVSVAKAQEKDPQNMPVAPQNTSCQGLPKIFASQEAAINAVEGAKYYFEQEFTTTRNSGFQSAEFLSCDFETGYLVVTHNNTKQIYTGVTQEFWDRFLESGDPDGFYESEIKKLSKVAIKEGN